MSKVGKKKKIAKFNKKLSQSVLVLVAEKIQAIARRRGVRIK